MWRVLTPKSQVWIWTCVWRIVRFMRDLTSSVLRNAVAISALYIAYRVFTVLFRASQIPTLDTDRQNCLSEVVPLLHLAVRTSRVSPTHWLQ
jgi:hypothetical protein